MPEAGISSVEQQPVLVGVGVGCPVQLQWCLSPPDCRCWACPLRDMGQPCRLPQPPGHSVALHQAARLPVGFPLAAAPSAWGLAREGWTAWPDSALLPGLCALSRKPWEL